SDLSRKAIRLWHSNCAYLFRRIELRYSPKAETTASRISAHFVIKFTESSTTGRSPPLEVLGICRIQSGRLLGIGGFPLGTLATPRPGRGYGPLYLRMF